MIKINPNCIFFCTFHHFLVCESIIYNSRGNFTWKQTKTLQKFEFAQTSSKSATRTSSTALTPWPWSPPISPSTKSKSGEMCWEISPTVPRDAKGRKKYIAWSGSDKLFNFRLPHPQLHQDQHGHQLSIFFLLFLMLIDHNGMYLD